MCYWPKRLQIGFDAALFLLLCHQFPLAPAAHVRHPLLLCSLWTVNPTFCDVWCVTVKADKKRNDLLILNWTLVKIWLKLTCFLKNVLSFYSLLLLLSKADLFIIKVVNLNVWCSKVKQKVKRKNLSTEDSASASHICFFWSWKIFCLTSSSCGITLSFLFLFKSIFQPIISWLTYNIFVAAFWSTSH